MKCECRAVKTRSLARCTDQSPTKMALIACPSGWNASAFGCHRVIKAAVRQHECPALCGPNATLACVGSAAENAHVAELAASESVLWSWLGHYSRNEGWLCAAGGAVAFEHWDNATVNRPGEAGDGEYAYRAHCAATVVPFEGRWTAHDCAPTEGSFLLMMARSCGGCVCEYGAESSPDFTAYADDTRRAHEAYMEPKYVIAAIWFAVVVPFISALPFLCSLCCSCARRARRSRDSKADDELASAGGRSAGALLAEAEIASVRLRQRVSGTIAQVGWTLCVIGWGPFFIGFIGAVSSGALLEGAGSFTWYVWAAISGPWVMVLALRPTDALRIRIASRIFFGLLILIVSGCVLAILGNVAQGSIDALERGLVVILTGGMGLLCAACTAALAPAIFSCRDCCASSAMTPRGQLRRLWLVLRCWLFGAGLLADGDVPFVRPCQLADTNNIGIHVAAGCALLAAVVLTPSNRARVHRWLGSLGSNASKQQEAAAVAALLGGSGRSAATALRQAEESFRALRLSSLRVEDLTDNKPSPQLFDQTLPVKMGEVGAFVSHSWSDAGALKFGHVEKFAATRGGGDCLIWLDKACIDQSSIDANLACLPVWLSGCSSLLVLAGPTYTSRLWYATRARLPYAHASHHHRPSPVHLVAGASSSSSPSCAWAARATTSRSACSTPTRRRCGSSPSSTPARRSASSRRIVSASWPSSRRDSAPSCRSIASCEASLPTSSRAKGRATPRGFGSEKGGWGRSGHSISAMQ